MWDEPSNCGFTPGDVFRLLDFVVAIMWDPSTGEISHESSILRIIDLKAYGWEVLMDRRQARDILLTGSVQDVLRVLSSRIPRKLAAV